ncbi:MAG: NTP transferase domain-containing protein, partial [Chthoniobacterales bacterium]
MGRDKALLEIDGVPLWQRQLETLRQLNPEQLMIAGAPHLSSRAERSEVEGSLGISWKRGNGNFTENPRDPSAPLGMTIADEMGNAGPLAG